MNIFALSNDPREAAIWQHDRHVVKMILESAQMLSTAAHEGMFSVGAPDYLYKSTHANHPCNVWLRSSMANVAWLTMHLDSLVAEYHRRFRKHHATDLQRQMFNNAVREHLGVQRFWTRDPERHLIVDPAIINLASQHTPFAVCMADAFKCDDAITSYRMLYIESKIFQDHVKWTRCDQLPQFIVNAIMSANDRVSHRVRALMDCHVVQMVPTSASVQPHPDSQKEPNPKALTRFGRRTQV